MKDHLADSGYKRLLSVKEAARYLSIGTTLLYEWISRGRIPCLKINTRRVIDIEDLDRFIDDLKVEQGLGSKND